jgi:hypothetical protein
MSTRVSALISLAVHGAIVAALLWMGTGGDSGPAADPGFFGTASGESTQGLATKRSPPPAGPSVPPDRAADYLGTYRLVAAIPPDTNVVVTVVNDGDVGHDHWSLMVQEGEGAAYKLVLVAPDSFVHQLDRRRHIAFARVDGAVTSIEFSGVGPVRRGVR